MLTVVVLAILTTALLGWWLFLFRTTRWSAAAEGAGRSLLCGVLAAEEQQQLAQFGYLVVRSPSVPDRHYRIPADGGYVYAYEAGKGIMAICLQPVTSLPPSDVVLMHKLMIEGNEQGYLSQANIQWLPGRSGTSRRSAGDPSAPEFTWTVLP